MGGLAVRALPIEYTGMTTTHLTSRLWMALAAILLATAAIMPARGQTADDRAIAVIRAPETGELMGYVWFTQSGEELQIQGKIKGLQPNSTHGFHVHQFGDTSAEDGTSAGGHYNPGNDPHGAPDDPQAQHHAGDLGNIQANAQGIAEFTKTVDFVSLRGDRGILGRAIVVHGGADDFTSQPSGDAGPRIGLGTIGLAGESWAIGPEDVDLSER